ncbi:hypothetical protein SK128_012333, partial [Halocaridina rubra]
IGAIPALINYNLREDPLAHCIKVANCKAIVCGKETQDAINDLTDNELTSLPTYVLNAAKEEIVLKDAVCLDSAFASAEKYTPPQLENVGFTDKMVYIYTSGTTGLPKAAVIKHSRASLAAIGMATMIGATSLDILYDPLPLYHTAGGIMGVGQTLVNGATVVIRRKFSVTHYWSDCLKYGCTVRIIVCHE